MRKQPKAVNLTDYNDSDPNYEEVEPATEQMEARHSESAMLVLHPLRAWEKTYLSNTIRAPLPSWTHPRSGGCVCGV